VLIFAESTNSLMHRVDPRLRVVAAFLFALLVCLSGRFAVLWASLGVAFCLMVLARLGPGRVLGRLAKLNFFMLLLLLLMPLTMPGEPVARLWGLAWSREGALRAGLIALRANAILIALCALVGTMEPAHLGFALSRLGIPDKLCHLFLFMVRYIEVIHHEYHHLRDAMRLRGFRPRCSRHTFRTLGYLTGMLLVRSLDRSERILEAMKCRAFRGRFYVLAPFRIRARDMGFAAVAIGCLFLLGWMEWR